MNHEDELANRIARLLDEGPDDLSADTRERLAHVRKLALSRQQGRKVQALVPALAGPISRVTEQSVFGVRYVIPLAALILGLIGVVYVNRSNLASDIADIDAGLLTDELPINAYPGPRLRFMAKTLVALIASLCIAFTAAAAQPKADAKKAAPRPAWTESQPPSSRCLRRCSPNGSSWIPRDVRNGSRSRTGIRP